MAEDDILPQPQDIPWQLLCTSEDMMDPTWCNRKFPMPWKSSVAISAYEPKAEDLPTPFCAGKITYLKVTVSITGYQPTDEEIKKGYEEFANTPIEVALDDIFETYFGCYGVLLNIGLFPNSAREWNIQDFPKIIAMEPKVRELVQNATESGELLTSSKGSVSTSKSFSSTHTTKTGVSGKIGGKVSGNVKKIVDIEGSFEMGATGEWGNTISDSTQTNIDNSTDRSETQSTSTDIEQMYNLLSAYHLGTNRGVFLMLPRPHMLQPTDRRTFIQGVRSIEGIQEFFLIVSRPNDMEGICVEARLDTGHFPENIEIKKPEEKYKESQIEFIVKKNARNGANNGKGLFNQQGEVISLNTVYNAPQGFYIDKRTTPNPPFPKGDAGHVGIKATDLGGNSQGSPINYSYYTTDTAAIVNGSIQGAWGTGPGAIFNSKYTVYLRSIEPIPSDLDAKADIAGLFVTSRSLCCCFYKRIGVDCFIKGKISSIPPSPPVTDYMYSHIVEQRRLKISEDLLRDASSNTRLEPAIKGILRQLKSIMITTREGRFSHFEEGITFLDSDFFIHNILNYFPDDIKNIKLEDINDLNIRVKNAYGVDATVNDALSDTLEQFIIKTKLIYSNAIIQRQIIVAQIKNFIKY
jgi:hypothetical protein